MSEPKLHVSSRIQRRPSIKHSTSHKDDIRWPSLNKDMRILDGRTGLGQGQGLSFIDWIPCLGQ